MKVVTAIPWLILATLVVAVVTMSTWWQVASIQVTGWATWIFMFATMGLWVSLFLVAFTLWRLLVSRSSAVKKSANASCR